MQNTIQEYQMAFNLLVDRLKANESILAVMVFGSIVTGDLWEESDIDIFVISKDKIDKIINIYTEEEGIPVHIKLMSKEKLLSLHKEELVGGFIHRIFVSSRLVFSKDEEITGKYDIGRYYPDIDREKWNMVYLGDLLKSISVCKKYIDNGGNYMAYGAIVKCIEDYSKLYINSSGYMISKDVMTMALNLDDDLKETVHNLFYGDRADVKNKIQELINFFENNVERNLKKYTSLLLEFMKKKDSLLSSEDVKNDDFFRNYKIDFEIILNKLLQKKVVKKESREYRDDCRNMLFKEKVYFI